MRPASRRFQNEILVIEQARLAEAAKFDLIFIVDSQFITADSPPHYLTGSSR